MIDDSKKNIVGIHQPNFLPWLGYFVKINKSNTFVFHDQVEFSKRSYTKRVKIRDSFDSLETKYLTIPLVKKSDFTLIKDIEIANNIDWQKKHLAQIYNCYHKCDHFQSWYTLLKDWYEDSSEIVFLAELNIYFIQSICKELGLESKFYRSSQLEVTGKKDDLNVGIVKRLKGDAYCSGAGGVNYQSSELFASHNVELYVHRTFDLLKESPYILDSQKFVNGISIIDALFYLGTAATAKLIQSIPIIKHQA